MSNRIYSPETVYDRWRNYGKRYAVHRSLHDSSVACMFGPLVPNEQTTNNIPGLADRSGRTAGAAWSVGAGDVPKYTQGSVRGQGFWGADFDNTNDYAIIQSTAGLQGLNLAGPISCSTWLYITSTTDFHEIISVGSGAQAPGYVLSQYSGRITAGASLDYYRPYRFAAGYPTIATSQWIHFASTQTGPANATPANASMTHYYNGAAYTCDASAMAYNITGAWLGRGYYGYYGGSMMGPTFWNRVLTPNEIDILATHPLEAYRVKVPYHYFVGGTAAGFRGPVVGCRIIRTKPSPLFIRGA